MNAIVKVLLLFVCLSGVFLRQVIDLGKYNSLDVIDEYLHFLAKTHSNLIRTFELGRSHQSRSLTVLQIGNSGPAVWVDAGIHAREWISVAVALNFLNRLAAKPFGENVTFYVLPVVNPDGYQYSMTRDRFWRKNRHDPCTNRTFCCQGVDLNRNFDSNWRALNDNFCSQISPGQHAFSEPETRAIRDFLVNRPIQLFISLHSFGQLLVLPRGVTEDNPTYQLALKAAEAMKEVHGTEYSVGTSQQLFNSSSGGLSKDWAYEQLGVKYSYTVELRPNAPRSEFVEFCGSSAQCAFLLDPKEIAPTAEETWKALEVMVEQIVKEHHQ